MPVDGRLTVEQYNALAGPINPNRVREHDDGTPWIEGTDVRRWLTRIFGYGGWGSETLRTVVLGEEMVPADDGETKPAWQVTRETTVRLTVRTPAGAVLTTFDGTAACTKTCATLGEAHNDATNTAETFALKRAAANLSDLFGLGLRVGVLLKPYIGGALARPDGTPAPAWAAAQEDEPAPVPDCAPADNDDVPRRPVTAAEGARLIAAASRGPIPLTTRPLADITAALEASIVRARQARDDEALVPS